MSLKQIQQIQSRAKGGGIIQPAKRSAVGWAVELVFWPHLDRLRASHSLLFAWSATWSWSLICSSFRSLQSLESHATHFQRDVLRLKVNFRTELVHVPELAVIMQPKKHAALGRLFSCWWRLKICTQPPGKFRKPLNCENWNVLALDAISFGPESPLTLQRHVWRRKAAISYPMSNDNGVWNNILECTMQLTGVEICARNWSEHSDGGVIRFVTVLSWNWEQKYRWQKVILKRMQPSKRLS
jgi:hypothetical protein